MECLRSLDLAKRNDSFGDRQLPARCRLRKCDIDQHRSPIADISIANKGLTPSNADMLAKAGVEIIAV
jgi:hypothetical protein